jgi:hypothetical protein
MKLTRLVAVLVFAAPGLAQGAAAQDLIPRELVEGLLASGPRRSTVYVGEIPPEMIGRIYIPTGARVLGGMSSGVAGTAILIANRPREAVAAELERELPKAGWTQFDRNSLAADGLEFRDPLLLNAAVKIRASGGYQNFCGKSGPMAINLEPVNFADTRISIVVNSLSPCNGPVRPVSADQRAELAMRPTLVNPAGAQNDITGDCFGGRTGDRLSTGYTGGGLLMSGMSAQALLDHYGKQLVDSGWTLAPQTRTTRFWTKTDSSGKPVQYSLTVETLGIGPTCRVLTSQLRTGR